MRYSNGEENILPTHIDDAIKTMAVVESAYQSDKQGGVPMSEVLNRL
jgi:hypothetical protein